VNWRDLLPSPWRRAQYLIRAAAWLVPAALRAEWRREWMAELHYALRTMLHRGEEGTSLVDFARGAFEDAMWYRTRGWSREEMERTAWRRSQSAGFGKTIPSAVLPKFFDLFSVEEASTPGKDLGLGPAVAYRILSLFGASVSLANQNDPPGIRLIISLRNATPNLPR